MFTTCGGKMPIRTLLCIGTGSRLSDQNRCASGRQLLPALPEEMMRIRRVPEAITNTLKVAEMCDVNLDDRCATAQVRRAGGL